MTAELIELLRCPACHSRLETGETDELRCASCKAAYPVRDAVPVFTHIDALSPTERNFSRQWTLVRQGHFEPPGLTYAIADRALMKKALGPFIAGGARTILDAGCGTGAKAREAAALFPDATIVAIDVGTHVRAADERTRRMNNFHCVRGTIDALPFAAEAFDLVVCHGVLHHLHRQEASFAELLRVTRTGGHLSLWLYPQCADLQDPLVRSSVRLYYGMRTLFLRRAFHLGPKGCRALATVMGAILCPFLLAFVWPAAHRFLKEFEGGDYFARTLRTNFRSIVFGIFDNLIPEIQSRYSVERVQAMARMRGCSDVVSFTDDTSLEFNRIPGFHSIRK